MIGIRKALFTMEPPSVSGTMAAPLNVETTLAVARWPGSKARIDRSATPPAEAEDESAPQPG